MKTIYKSKVSGCIFVVYGVSILSMLPIFLIDFSWLASITLLLLLVVETMAFFGIRYIICGNTLEVRTMYFLKKTYCIDKITSVSPTNSLLSAPAASFDRLCIIFNDGTSLIVSPERNEDFIAHINSSLPAKEMSV